MHLGCFHRSATTGNDLDADAHRHSNAAAAYANPESDAHDPPNSDRRTRATRARV